MDRLPDNKPRLAWRIMSVLAPCVLLLISDPASEDSTGLSLGSWLIGWSSLGHLGLCVLFGLALTWLTIGVLRDRRGLYASCPLIGKLATWGLMTLLFAWLALSLLAAPLSARRTIDMSAPADGVAPIQAQEVRHLNALWDIFAATGDPLPPSDDTVFHLFRLAPSQSLPGQRIMSCPDHQISRSRLFTTQRHIELERWDLPVQAHVPYALLAGFCEPGIHLSGPAADPSIPDDVRERLKRLAGPRTTTYSDYELASASGRPDLARPGPGKVSARARYLLYLHTQGRIEKTASDGMDLASHQDLLLAANQCDVGYTQFLLDRGVLGAGPALLYLARELDGSYERDASLQRDPAFPLGLAHRGVSPHNNPSTDNSCLAVARLLVQYAPENIRATPVVERILAMATRSSKK